MSREDIMLAWRVYGRWLAAALFAAAMFVLPRVVMAQAVTCPRPASAPVTATLFFQNPPPGGVFAVGSPITLVLQIQNASSTAPVCTTEGFSKTEFWRRLVFTAPFGMVTNAGEAAVHGDTRLFHCLSRRGVLLQPTAISVVPVEVLSTSFFQQYTYNAASFYDLTRPGRYAVRAQFPFLAFDATDPTQVFSDCDQFAGVTVVNVGLTPGTGATSTPASGGQAFTIVSNSLEFAIAQFNFVGFLPPIVNDTACSAPPCRTYKFGSTIPVKFQLFDATGAIVPNAIAHISVTQISGSPPAMTPLDLGTGNSDIGNVARFDAASGQYIFNLGTKVVTPGVWRVDVSFDDGTVRSVLIGLI